MFDGQVLDGRNRLVACAMANTKPYFETLYTCDSPTSYVLSLNIHRRDLTQSQRATIATDAEPLFAAELKEKQKKAGGDKRSEAAKKTLEEKVPQAVERAPQARDLAAKAVGVNPRYVSDAKAIKEKSPETFEKVRSGEMSIPEANPA